MFQNKFLYLFLILQNNYLQSSRANISKCLIKRMEHIQTSIQNVLFSQIKATIIIFQHTIR